MTILELIAYALAVAFGLLAAFNVPAKVVWLGLAVACLAVPPFIAALAALT